MATGLGGVDPFARRRDEAAQKFLPTKPPPEDDDEGVDQGEQPPETASNSASTNASNAGTVGAGPSKEDKPVPTPTVTAESGQPPPPPSREPEARVQFNQRIKGDRRRVLDKYRRQHGSTWQAVFDQMVDEYLERRGLLPKDPG